MNSQSVCWGPVRWSFPFAGLLACVAALPLGVALSLGPLNLIHLTAAAVIVISVISRVVAGTTPWRWHPSAIWLLGLLLVYLASMITTRDPLTAAHTVLISILGGALALTVHTVCVTAARWRIMLTVLIASGTLVAVYGFATRGAVQAQSAGAGALSGRAVGVFTDPNQLGTFSAVLLMIAWAQALVARNWPIRILAILCAVLSAVNLVVSFSRGAWLGAFAGALLLMVLTVKYYRKWTLRIVALATVVGIPAFLIAAPPESSLVTGRLLSIFEPGSNPNDNRPFIYREAYRQIQEHPVLGQGPGSFSPTSLLAERTGMAVDAVHAHNLFLQVAAEAGVVAAALLVMFAAVLAQQTWKMWTEVPRYEAAMGMGLVSALLSVLVQGMVDYTLGNPILYFLVWIVLGALFAVTKRARDAKTNRFEEGTVQ
ncbi:O-antigen ligase family protein [Brevibacterium sp.]|uniref:O-antigen ligase n=1 Tax=Brevibacterium antiquum CNRZ 918 TaxID=1255637 RepID=A0A2H1KZM6_9MICO|nr:O-antigen ligase family protein [Brevibacterium sp.]SMY05190.1 O-antigen ligase [Brevibacterium antiquum CNRZ 918]HCG56534.1 hypothetical protein [Brevibacterium sp.]